MPRITELYAFIAEESPEDEGLMAARTYQGWMPLVGADMNRVKSLSEVADEISALTGKPYKLLRFQLVGEITRDEIERGLH